MKEGRGKRLNLTKLSAAAFLFTEGHNTAKGLSEKLGTAEGTIYKWVKLPEWQKAGVRNVDGTDLPSRSLSARLILPEGVSGPAFLAYSNYESILRWNRSNYYALAIGMLSDTLR